MEELNEPVMIAVERLTKFYGNARAIEDISFSCRRGEIVGFLGPNGLARPRRCAS